MFARTALKSVAFAAGAFVAVAALAPAANVAHAANAGDGISSIVGAQSIPLADASVGGAASEARDLPTTYSAKVGLMPQAPRAASEMRVAPAGASVPGHGLSATYSAKVGAGPWSN